ncbi:MAG: ABC transporter ATP-binding protein [Chitinophagales bacterium]|nr:ABC transporter ATP-binding protein [Chitinophagales bacterium]MDW8427522.1 ABC transporter ATP-binding protein [Chitinophagales bacterium]
MTITINHVARRFQSQWVFRDVHLRLSSGAQYALMGPNGSGKTTLLHLIGGFLMPTVGTIQYQIQQRPIDPQHLHRYLSFAAPYIELIDNFSVLELVRWQSRLKPLKDGITAIDVLKQADLWPHAGKRVDALSSGLRQRLQLALALMAQTPLVLLDEPTANLDAESVLWYQQLLQAHSANRLVVIASNQEADLIHCTSHISVLDFKG